MINNGNKDNFDASSVNQNYLDNLNLQLPGVRSPDLGPLPDLSGKFALVTGGGTGIGRGVVLQLARAGAKVVMHWFNEKNEVDRTYAQLETERANHGVNGEIIPMQGDLSSITESEALFIRSLEKIPQVDILVNNCGVTRNLPLGDWSAEHIQRLFQINCIGPIYLTKVAATHMKERGIRGEIVFMSSPHAHAGMTGHTVYAATKGAIESFARVAAVELADPNLGIRVNHIVPGWVLVENHFRAEGADADFSGSGKGIPAGRQTIPEEIGTLVTELAAGKFPGFHGNTIYYDGGQMIRWQRGTSLPEQPGSARFGEQYF